MKISKLSSIISLSFLILQNNSNAELVITASAANEVNFALENGSVLTGGSSRIEIGYYSSAVSRGLFESYTTAASFTTGWTAIGSGIANFFDLDGLTTIEVTLPDGNNSLLNKQLFFLVGNASSIATSSQLGVYTFTSNSFAPSVPWIVPTNPSNTTDVLGFDIQDVGKDQSGILFGSFSSGTGAYPDEGVINSVRLQTVVPEPSTGALMMIGAVGLVALRRLRKV